MERRGSVPAKTLGPAAAVSSSVVLTQPAAEPESAWAAWAQRPSLASSPALTVHTGLLPWPLLLAGRRRRLLPEMTAEDTDVLWFIPWLLLPSK